MILIRLEDLDTAPVGVYLLGDAQRQPLRQVSNFFDLATDQMLENVSQVLMVRIRDTSDRHVLGVLSVADRPDGKQVITAWMMESTIGLVQQAAEQAAQNQDGGSA